MAWKLCSKDDVRALVPVNDVDLVDFFSESVEGLIKEYLGTENLGITVQITDELHDGDGTNILIVRKPPVISVNSVSIADTALLASDYEVIDDSIQLKYITFPAGKLNVKITYQSGSVVDEQGQPESINPVIRLTAAAMIVAMLNYRGRAGADQSLKWGTAEQKEGENTPNRNVGLTSHLKTIMKRMLLRSKIRVF